MSEHRATKGRRRREIGISARSITLVLLTCSAALLGAALALDQARVGSRPISGLVEARMRSGLLTANVSWVIDPLMSTDALRGRIEYSPNRDPGNSCSVIRFVQVAKVEQTQGRDLNWSNDGKTVELPSVRFNSI